MKYTGDTDNIIRYVMEEKLKKPDVVWDIAEHKEKRSLNANGLFWHCCEEIAKKTKTDKWSIYLELIKRHGKFEYILVKPKAVEAMKKQWRECEEIGEVDVNGQKAMQLICYYGSSTYDSKQFSVLIDDAIDEMKRLGLQPPADKHIQAMLDDWARNYG